MQRRVMDELCEAMEKLSLSDSHPKHHKKARPAIRCWKCSELGHIKRFCKKDKPTQWVIRKRKRENFLSPRSAKQKIDGESNGNKIYKSSSFKLKPPRFIAGTSIVYKSNKREPLRRKQQNNYKSKRKFIEEDE